MIYPGDEPVVIVADLTEVRNGSTGKLFVFLLVYRHITLNIMTIDIF
jgi:hypothetical protein